MARMGIRNSIGGLYFDAAFKVDHTSKLTLTTHPVEDRADITDHAYREPDEVSIEIGMSDVALQRDHKGGSRSVTAYKELRKLQEKREPLTVVTRLKTYKNMLIESISTADDYTTMNALRATVMLKEIMVVSTTTVKVAPRNAQTNGGTKQPVDAKTNQSVLKQAMDKLGL